MDTWTMINQRNDALQPFYKKVDVTRKRLNLTPFKMTDPLTRQEIDDVINVTENKSVSYMKRIIAGLMSSKWQSVVEGEVSKREAHKIELFNEDCLQQADEYLFNEYGLTGLDTWLTNHVCHTSLLGVQWMARVEDGEYKIHCLPTDMRWTPHVLNKWVAPITWRDKEDLVQELEDYKKLAMDDEVGDFEFALNAELLKDKDNEVRDYWDGEKNELWVEKQLVFRQQNPYGKPPFVIVWVPSGFYFRDKGYLANESPSLLYANEELYDQLSRQLSIDATLGFNVLNPAYEKEREQLSADNRSEPVPKRGESVDVLKGERHLPVPTPDINRAELATREQVGRLIDEAAPITPRAYNTPPSAIEVATEVELLDELQNPRIIALQMFKAQLARINIEQVLLLGGKGSMLVGRTGRQGNFSIADLKDPKKYAVNYQFMKHNKRLAIVNEARAMAMWGKAPMKYILRDVLGVEDPDGWERAMDLEKAEVINPALRLKKMAIKYAEEAEDTDDEIEKASLNLDSQLMVHEYVMLMRQRMNPVQPQETENLREATKEAGNSQGLIKMLGPAASGPQLTGAQKGAIQ